MVVALHRVVKDLVLRGAGVGDEELFDDDKDIIANVRQLVLDPDLVIFDDGYFVSVALLFDGCNHSPGGTTRSNGVFVGDGEEVALLDSEFLWLAGHLLHVVDHFIEALGLFGELGLVDEGVAIRRRLIQCDYMTVTALVATTNPDERSRRAIVVVVGYGDLKGRTCLPHDRKNSLTAVVASEDEKKKEEDVSECHVGGDGCHRELYVCLIACLLLFDDDIEGE
jgi:hypothetical protein